MEAARASTYRPGSDQQQVIEGVTGGAGGGSGSVGGPGPGSPLHDEQIEGSQVQTASTVRPSREWREQAVCRETDPELFFPTATHGRVYEAQVAAAKAVCARCPVRVECLEDALVGMPVGIAGGLTEGERRSLRRRQVAGRRVDERRGRARELLGQGVSAGRVASRVGVSARTVERWAADDRAVAGSRAEPLAADAGRAAVS